MFQQYVFNVIRHRTMLTFRDALDFIKDFILKAQGKHSFICSQPQPLQQKYVDITILAITKFVYTAT